MNDAEIALVLRRYTERLAALGPVPEALGWTKGRHTLRYRMERLAEQTGRHPDKPQQRMELWLAVKAAQALQARSATATA